MKQILVGVDGSNESRAAAQRAATIAAGTGAMLRLVCVVPPFEALTNVIPSPRQVQDQRASAKAIVEEVARELKGVQVETEVGDGSPAEILAGIAGQPEVEMVAIGHRGRGLLSRMLVGSVTSRLVQISPKSVLVVR